MNDFPVKMGEEVVIIAGKDRSRADKVKAGKITSINRKTQTVTVEGLNISKKAVRPSEANPEGGIVEFEAPIHVSNVMTKAKYDARSAKKA
ncbi:50S ribosomal protein L24 [Lentisphaera araneosa HTCC2155]|jgi:large subunit ribosomal protein L24|uniref:Large ribosomal subunit protein uL24 n=1 Tax=Lentisphaera araneosa HTCC2155 TaxID=313628 RepID=A6DRC1_9BACT|nr:50S ribosomal protein L24 [Lentisphaera araneosa HTCC2155]